MPVAASTSRTGETTRNRQTEWAQRGNLPRLWLWKGTVRTTRVVLACSHRDHDRTRLPAITLFPEFARRGGLLAYGPDIQALCAQAGAFTRKVLLGTNPAETPVERPTRFLLVANFRTAKALGITLPTSVLLRADEVIE